MAVICCIETHSSQKVLNVVSSSKWISYPFPISIREKSWHAIIFFISSGALSNSSAQVLNCLYVGRMLSLIVLFASHSCLSNSSFSWLSVIFLRRVVIAVAKSSWVYMLSPFGGWHDFLGSFLCVCRSRGGSWANRIGDQNLGSSSKRWAIIKE